MKHIAHASPLTFSLTRPLKAISLGVAATAAVCLAPQPSLAQGSLDSMSYAQGQAQAQLQSLVAPIALYPDPLVAQVLQASTYPDQVSEAAIQVASNPSPAAIDSEFWDASVIAVAHYPPVIEMMANQITWTEQLGHAYLSQQAQVFQAIQALRAKAVSLGNLKNTSQQQVVQNGDVVSIYPATPLMYVPQYDPVVVYNQAPMWGAAPLIGFGAGWAIGSAMNTTSVNWAGGTIQSYPPGAGWRTAYANDASARVAGVTADGTAYAGREGATTLANGAEVKGYQGAAVGPDGAAAGRGWNYSNGSTDAGGFSRTVDTDNGVYNIHGAGVEGANGSDGAVTATHVNNQGQVTSSTVTDRDGDISSDDLRSDNAFSEAHDNDWHPAYADRGAESRQSYGGDALAAHRFGGGGFGRR